MLISIFINTIARLGCLKEMLRQQPTLSVSSSLVCSSSVFCNFSQLTSSWSSEELSPPDSTAPSASSSCRLRFELAAITETVEARFSVSLSAESSAPALDALDSLDALFLEDRAFTDLKSSPLPSLVVSSVSAGGSDNLTVTIESWVTLGVAASASSGVVGLRAGTGADPASASAAVEENSWFCCSSTEAMAAMRDGLKARDGGRLMTAGGQSGAGKEPPRTLVSLSPARPNSN